MTKIKIIDRIKKLLELSKSSNEHEAANAAARAAEMMLDNQIAEAELEDDVGEPEPITEETIGQDGKTVHWRLDLVNGLATSLGCYCYYKPGYSGRKVWRNGRRVTIGQRDARYQVVGPQSAVDTVRYMYKYLVKEVVRLANTAFADEVAELKASGLEAPSARAWKGSFRVGCASMLESRLAGQRKKTLDKAKTDGKTQALLVIDQQKQAVTDYVKQKHPKMRSGSGSTAGGGSSSGFQSGIAAGKNVNLGGGRGALSAGNKRLGN